MNKAKKLEIGAGRRPKEDYDHMDMDGTLPHIEIVGDARKIPVEEGIYDEVYTHWVLEHFAWREMVAVLQEWKRVLKPGGKVEIVTNNQEAHNKCLSENNISWQEWVRLTYGIRFDAENIDKKGSIPPLADCHKIGFTQDLLVDFLKRAGFEEVIVSAQWQCREVDGRIKCPGLMATGRKPL